MTGYTVNTGTSVKFSEGWDRIFGSGASAKADERPGKKSAAPKPKPGKIASPAAKAAAKGTAKNHAKTAAGKTAKVQSKDDAEHHRTSGNL